MAGRRLVSALVAAVVFCGIAAGQRTATATNPDPSTGFVNSGVAGSVTGDLILHAGTPQEELWDWSWLGASLVTDTPTAPSTPPPVDGVHTFIGYCIDVHTESSVGAPYALADWASVQSLVLDGAIADPGRVVWAVMNGYDGMNLADLQSRMEADGVVFATQLDNDAAVAGTQVAIWHYAHGYIDLGVNVDAPSVRLVYDWILSHAVPMALPVPPVATVSPSAVTATSDMVGPFTIDGPAGSFFDVSAAGGVVVDVAGVPIVSPVADGGEVWLSVDRSVAGSASVTWAATVDAPSLQFNAVAGTAGDQAQAFRSSSPVSLVASASASWDEAAVVTSTTVDTSTTSTTVDVASSTTTAVDAVATTTTDVGAGAGAAQTSTTVAITIGAGGLPNAGADSQQTLVVAAVVMALGVCLIRLRRQHRVH